MFGTALIVFREVLEAALIVGIVSAATRGIPGRERWIGAGILAGLLGALGVAAGAGAISQLAEGMGQATYTPPRGADDPEIQALTAIFSHGEGLKVLHETIQYLVERSQDEDSWLKALAALEVPTTFIWGVYDTVSPPRVVSYVWNEYMMKKPGANSLYFIPDANHYLQNDQPDSLVETFLHALEAPKDSPPGALSQRLASPLLVDRSRSELPRADDLLKGSA